MSYDHREIEPKWQKYWQENKLYQAEDKSSLPKFTAVDMFPYPSGDLHIGHWYALTGPDIYSRYKRMKGFNVMHPFGFDAFGLPAENAAIKRGLHPQDWTKDNVASMLEQMKTTGFSFDLSRLVNTSDPDYYKWTQWMFLQFYKKGLAYRKMASVNWCEHDQTVLANEQVIDGLCWRCDNPVIQKDLEQWFFKITDYAEELIDGLSIVDWPANTIQQQKNWIGKSVGAEISFDVLLADDGEDKQPEGITVFSTRPDTIYGVTYIVLAPEHKLVTKITAPQNRHEVEAYIAQTQRLTERQRLSSEQKTGVFTGGYAIHPLTNQRVPIWVADYVLATYGTGAVMGVPAHDRRDWDFAQQYKLPIAKVIDAEEQFAARGPLINSQQFNGLDSQVAQKAILEHLQKAGRGQAKTTYKLRDWLISRQRYWGPPIPMIDCNNCGLVPVPEQELPVVLPRDVDFLPKGKAPLETNQEFIHTECPKCHQPAQRVAETLDTFVDSSWYFLRYADPHNQTEPFDRKAAQKWLPVDLYVGGAEHTVLHLMYSRFFVKALRDMGYLQFDEPFLKLRHQGMILGPDHQKMSKSKGNVVNPDELVTQFGADAVRMQLAFLGPFDQGGPWQLTGIHGVARFLNKIWQEQSKRSAAWAEQSSSEVSMAIAELINKVETDLDLFKFNTCIAQLMKTVNSVTKAEKVSKKDWEHLIITLSPFAPFITEEMWHSLGHDDSIHKQTWPSAKLSLLETSSQADISVQVNGKFRALMQVHGGSEAELVKQAQEIPAIQRHLEGKKIVKHIYIPEKVLNIIVS